MWGGLQDEGYTESVREANNAVDLLQAADTIRTLDQVLFVELITSGVCSEDGGGDDVACDQVLANMSDGGVAAVEEWLAGNEPAPFESSAYTEPLDQQGEAAKAVSEDFFLEAGEANGNGDNYELASTILTVVMFFAGVAVVLDETRGSRSRSRASSDNISVVLPTMAIPLMATPSTMIQASVDIRAS